MKKLFILPLVLALFSGAQPPALAQDQPAAKPSAEQLEKQKAEREQNAYRLLDQVIDEAQSLRLTENRVRVQITAADLLWDRNQGRARSLFAQAAEGVAELGRTPPPTGNRRNEAPNQDRRVFQLRQELVLAVARHDAQLAYQVLATTKPPAPIAQNTSNDPRSQARPQVNLEDNLEQMLLGRIAALDPKFAAQNAEQLMDKGQFPRTVGEVINQLYRQDPEAAAKLADKTVKRIQAANLLTNNEAALLAQSLLTAGMRLPTNESATSGPAPVSLPGGGRGPVLDQSAYVDLLSGAIDVALRVASQPQNQPQNNQRGAAQGRPAGRGPGAAPASPVARPGQNTGPTEAQTEQINARRLMSAVMSAMPVIEQHLPDKALAVRQKLTEMGVGTLSAMNQPPVRLPENPTADALMQAAATAQGPMQDRLYQQAAFRALEEGNTDRARQIATEHLTVKARDYVLKNIEVRELITKDGRARMEQIRQTLNGLQTDGEKLDLLIQLAGDAQKTNPKVAVQLLDEAKQIVNRRATSYEHFNQQLRVAHAYAAVDPARSFEVFEPAINQLNELLAAASVLNGFEVNMFRDGELTMQGGTQLTSIVSRVGQELATLARTDLERSEVLVGRFQMAEPRIMSRLQIVQGLLNTRMVQQAGGFPAAFMRMGDSIVRPE